MISGNGVNQVAEAEKFQLIQSDFKDKITWRRYASKIPKCIPK